MHSANHSFRRLLGLVPLSTLLLNIFVGRRSYRDSCEKVNRRPSSCSILYVHSATASVQELRPSALRSELAHRALRVSDSSPLAGSGSFSKTSALGNAAMPRLGSLRSWTGEAPAGPSSFWPGREILRIASTASRDSRLADLYWQEPSTPQHCRTVLI